MELTLGILSILKRVCNVDIFRRDCKLLFLAYNMISISILYRISIL